MMTKIYLIAAAVFTSLVYVVNSATEEEFRVPAKEIRHSESPIVKKLEIPAKLIPAPSRKNLVALTSCCIGCRHDVPTEYELFFPETIVEQEPEATTCFFSVTDCRMIPETVTEKNENVQSVAETKSPSRAEKEMSLKLFPNPMKHEARLEIEEYDEQTYSFELYDLSGKLIRQEINLTGRTYLIQRNDLPSGIYIWRFYGANNQVRSGKLIAA